VLRDSIEIPSHLCEHWVRSPRILQKLASHYVYQDEVYLAAWKSDNPSESVPPPRDAPLEVFDSIVSDFHPGNVANQCHYQKLLWKSKFDYVIHSYSTAEVEKAELGVNCLEILRNTGIFGMDGKRNNTYLNWNELNNYKAAYYCYL